MRAISSFQSWRLPFETTCSIISVLELSLVKTRSEWCIPYRSNHAESPSVGVAVTGNEGKVRTFNSFHFRQLPCGRTC